MYNRLESTFEWNNIDPNFIYDPSVIFNSLTDCDIAVFLSVYNYAKGDGICFASVSTMKKIIGICDKQVRNSLKKLFRIGLLGRHNSFMYGKFYDTNVYKVSNKVFVSGVMKKIRSKLKSWLSELFYLLKGSLVTLFLKLKRYSNKKSFSLYKGKNYKSKLSSEAKRLKNFFNRVKVE